MFKGSCPFSNKFYNHFNTLETIQHLDLEVHYYRIMMNSSGYLSVHRYTRAAQWCAPLRNVYLSGRYKEHIDILGQRENTHEENV